MFDFDCKIRLSSENNSLMVGKKSLKTGKSKPDRNYQAKKSRWNGRFLLYYATRYSVTVPEKAYPNPKICLYLYIYKYIYKYRSKSYPSNHWFPNCNTVTLKFTVQGWKKRRGNIREPQWKCSTFVSSKFGRHHGACGQRARSGSAHSKERLGSLCAKAPQHGRTRSARPAKRMATRELLTNNP